MSSWLDDFEQDATQGVRVNEGDLQTEEPRTRRFVNHLNSGGQQPCALGVDIGHLIGNVMHALAALRNERPTGVSSAYGATSSIIGPAGVRIASARVPTSSESWP